MRFHAVQLSVTVRVFLSRTHSLIPFHLVILFHSLFPSLALDRFAGDVCARTGGARRLALAVG